jgi:hypothetical protein
MLYTVIRESCPPSPHEPSSPESSLEPAQANAPAVAASYRSEGHPVPAATTVSKPDGVVPHVSAVKLPPSTAPAPRSTRIASMRQPLRIGSKFKLPTSVPVHESSTICGTSGRPTEDVRVVDAT